MCRSHKVECTEYMCVGGLIHMCAAPVRELVTLNPGLSFNAANASYFCADRRMNISQSSPYYQYKKNGLKNNTWFIKGSVFV